MIGWTLPLDRILETFAATEDATRTSCLCPAVDLADDGEVYRLVLEMPGVAKDGLEIAVEDGVLRVHGTRPTPEANQKLLVNGRAAARPFERRFRLGEEIDPAKIQARLENGLLTLTLPRRAEAKPRRVEIEIG